MKKAWLLLVILLIPSALAISIDMKPIYQPGETMIIEIFGNILEPIAFENIELKRINVQVPWEYDVKRVGEKYYLWGTVPNEENNYTLIIKDIVTAINGVPQNIDFSQNFSTQGELISYSIKPGFVITQDDQFEMVAFLYTDFSETISVNFPEEHELTLDPGENKLTFSTLSPNIQPGFSIIQIGIYSVPILIIKEPEDGIEILFPEFRFFPTEIESTILIDQEPFYPFRIINVGLDDLTNIVLEYNEDLFFITPDPIGLLGPNESIEFNLSLKVPNQDISEVIIARSGSDTIELPVIVTYTQDESEVILPEYLEEEFSENQNYYCSELAGKACAADEVCSIETISSLDVTNCCLGTCSAPKEKSYAWVGYLIGAIILIVLVIIGGRYIKTRKKGKGQVDILKRKVSEVEKTRFSF